MKKGTTIGLGIGGLVLLGGGLAWALTRRKTGEKATTPAARRAAARRGTRESGPPPPVAEPARPKSALEKLTETLVGKPEPVFGPPARLAPPPERYGAEAEITGASCYLAANKLNESADSMESSDWAFWRSAEEHDLRNDAAGRLRQAAHSTASHCSNQGFVPGPIQAKYNEAIMYAEADDPANVVLAVLAGERGGGTAGFLGFGFGNWRTI